jgi:glucose-1-phosphate thymidylyltransferase
MIMKVIIPVAGKGTRVRPHTWSKPKPFLRVGKSKAIEFVIDHMLTINPDCFIIVHDKWNGPPFKDFLPKKYPGQHFHFVLQEKQSGPADAILKTKHLITSDDEIFINYCDTLFIHDLSNLNKLKKDYDGVVYVKDTDDPHRFGIVSHENGLISEIVEKPEKPTSNLANIGAYYCKNGSKFISYIEQMIGKGVLIKGEFFLSDSFNIAIKEGHRYYADIVDDWLDVGKIETILESNAKLLGGGIWKGDNTNIDGSKIGENVSIGHNSVVQNCTVENSIIGDNCVLDGINIQDSVIGNRVEISKGGSVYNVGDNSTIS